MSYVGVGKSVASRPRIGRTVGKSGRAGKIARSDLGHLILLDKDTALESMGAVDVRQIVPAGVVIVETGQRRAAVKTVGCGTERCGIAVGGQRNIIVGIPRVVKLPEAGELSLVR